MVRYRVQVNFDMVVNGQLPGGAWRRSTVVARGAHAHSHSPLVSLCFDESAYMSAVARFSVFFASLASKAMSTGSDQPAQAPETAGGAASAGGTTGQTVVDDPVCGGRSSRAVESEPPNGSAPNSVGVDLGDRWR